VTKWFNNQNEAAQRGERSGREYKARTASWKRALTAKAQHLRWKYQNQENYRRKKKWLNKPFKSTYTLNYMWDKNWLIIIFSKTAATCNSLSVEDYRPIKTAPRCVTVERKQVWRMTHPPRETTSLTLTR